MKKILLALGIIFTGLCLTACGGGDDMGGTAEEQAAVNAVSTMISISNRGELQRDFYLTRTTLGDGVSVTWTSSNESLIKISTVDYKGQYDDKTYEYSLAGVTQTTSAKDVTLTANLTKGGAKLSLPFACRVVEDQFTNATTLEELEAISLGDKARMTVKVISSSTSSNGNVSIKVQAIGDAEGTTFTVYLGKTTTWLSYFEVGAVVSVEGTKDFYNGTQIKNVEFVKVVTAA